MLLPGGIIVFDRMVKSECDADVKKATASGPGHVMSGHADRRFLKVRLETVPARL